jgi:hypothetical protein
MLLGTPKYLTLKDIAVIQSTLNFVIFIEGNLLAVTNSLRGTNPIWIGYGF